MSKLELIELNLKSPDDLLDSRDVARMLSVDVSWVKNHCTRVEPFLPHVKLGGGRYATRRFRRDDIVKFIDEHLVTRLKRA